MLCKVARTAAIVVDHMTWLAFRRSLWRGAVASCSSGSCGFAGFAAAGPRVFHGLMDFHGVGLMLQLHRLSQYSIISIMISSQVHRSHAFVVGTS